MTSNNFTTVGIVNNTPRARAMRHLQEWLDDGRLVAGSGLPPEVQLAKKLDVSRTTIRVVLADLKEQGLIQLVNRKWVVKSNISPSRSLLSDCIALIVEPSNSPLDYGNVLHNPWHISFIYMGAVTAIRKAGFDAFIVHPDRIQGDLVQRMIAQRPRGVIILWRVLQEKWGKNLGRALQEGNVPFVIYGDLNSVNENTQAIEGIDSVVSDHEAGSYALTKWLISQGRKRILRFWWVPGQGPKDRRYWLEQRDVGYERAIREAGLESIPPLAVYDPSYKESGDTRQEFDFRSRVMAGYLVEYLQGPEPIDAIMAASDGMIGYLSAALRVHGKEPNRDVWLAGYDNMWDDLDVRQWEPLGPVATVDKKNLEIGSQLMSLLQEQIDGKIFNNGERRVIKPALIIRPSAFPDKRSLVPSLLPTS
jgi:DNA-binding LacI/PurR family transcriptional regulator